MLNVKSPSPLTRVFMLCLSLSVLLASWQILIWTQDLPAYILPAPWQVWQRFLFALHNGTLAQHSLVTLGETLSGLALGLSVGAGLGYILAHSPVLEKFLEPFLVASQAIPVVAVAPLLIIWFGSGVTTKILICGLIVFFPALVNSIVGLRSVEPDLHDLLRSLRANAWQHLIYLELPAALPVLLGGAKISATLAVIGAVVGEFVSADRGLGFLINSARNSFDTALVFVGLFTLVFIALSLYGAVVILEKIFLKGK